MTDHSHPRVSKSRSSSTGTLVPMLGSLAGQVSLDRARATIRPRSSEPRVVTVRVESGGPQDGDGNDIPGELEYEQIFNRVYRLDRRIDVSFETENGERWECGLLTDRAYDDLESTLAALDPSIDYGEHRPDCSTYGALVHIEDFEHSPFECAAECCHSDLLRAAIVYSVILNNFYGITPVIDGEPYVAIEPDQPCP